jgi:hypothetical protein
VVFALYLDEDVDVELAELLKSDGHDVLTTVEAGNANSAMSDEDQLAFSTARNRILFTHNVKDFYPLVTEWARSGKEHAGVIVSGRHSVYELHSRLRRFFESDPGEFRNLLRWLPGPIE